MFKIVEIYQPKVERKNLKLDKGIFQKIIILDRSNKLD